MTVASEVSIYSFNAPASGSWFLTDLEALDASYLALIDLDAGEAAATLVRGVHFDARLTTASRVELFLYLNAVDEGRSLRLERRTPATQDAEFSDYLPFNGSLIERLFDANAMRDAELREGLDTLAGDQARTLAACLRAPDALAILPDAAARAGGLIVFDPLGQPRVVQPASGVSELGGMHVMAALQLQTLDVPGTVDHVRAFGYAAPGDGGGGVFAAVGDSPRYATDILSADGRWWTPIAESRAAGLDARCFGASPSVPDNRDYLQQAIYSTAAQGCALVISDDLAASGPLITASHLRMRWAQRGLLRQIGFSGASGAFLSNIHPTDDAARVQDNLVFERPMIDLSGLSFVGNTTNSENALAFARGVSRLTIEGGLIKGARANFDCVGGIGGKGVGLDGGVVDARIEGVRIEGCYIGLWVRGKESLFDGTTIKERVARVRALGMHFDDCDVALGVQGRDTTESPDADFDDMSVVVEAMTYHNCGFAPRLKAGGTYRWKAGPIVLGEAQNVQINGLQGYNDPGYIAGKGGWPDAAQAVIGGGLSGPIGAVIYGWGRNVAIRNVQHGGDVDAIVWLARGAAIGDDTAGTSGRVEMRQFDVANARLVGAVSFLVEQDTQRPATSSANLSGSLLRASATTVTGALVGPTLAPFVSFYVDAEDETTGGRVEGSAKWIAATYGASIPGSGRQRTETAQAGAFFSGEVIIADDATATIAAPHTYGVMTIASSASLGRCVLSYRTASAQASLIGGSISNIVVGANLGLTGATGIDGNMTISVNDAGTITLENRRGASLTFRYSFQ